MENLESLNGDIPFNVLSRLPTKELIELKCVSKGWQNIISDQSFISIVSRRKEPLTGFFYQQKYQVCHDDIKTISYVPVEKRGADLHQQVFEFLPHKVVVMASCNGLVCCRTCLPFLHTAIYVCNPMNKQYIEVIWEKPDQRSGISLAYDPFQGFSDASTDFKVIRSLQLETEDEELYFLFDVYSSKTKTWVQSKEICWCSDKLMKNGGVFIGGVSHWLTDGYRILTFNVENELALLIPAPIPVKEFQVVEACIGESEDKLHYVMFSEDGLQLWCLEDYYDLIWSLEYSKSLTELEKEHPKVLSNLHERLRWGLTMSCRIWLDPLAFKDGILVMRVLNSVYFYNLGTSKMDEICEISKFGAESKFCPIVVPYCFSVVPLLRLVHT